MSAGDLEQAKPTGKADVRKIYVLSGELAWVGEATGPLDAIKRALEKEGNGSKVLDSTYFFLSERGFREMNAEWLVPISKGLKAAGYVYDDPDVSDD